MKNILLTFLAFITSYFIVHSINDCLTMNEVMTGGLIVVMTGFSFVAFKMKRA